MNSVTINKNLLLGQIRPMHCTNNIPAFSKENILDLFKEVVPYARLHDTFICAYDRFVDISNLFPNFDADETNPENYDFAFTDALMIKLQNMGVKPFYRLGVSIENYHHVKTYNIYPPKDYDKWARVCERIIMHYNEGWANGFYMDIEYWEIWNEPDNTPDVAENQMWKGTFEEYMRLYEVTSNHLKKRFPHLKIGGYASCGFYAVLEEKSVKSANVSSRTGYFIECFIKFLEYISSNEHKSPLDFFSWHSYAPTLKNIKFAEYARQTLDKYGFTKTQSILNEWNGGIELRGTFRDSSNVASNMIAMHNSGVDMLMYYDARINSVYGGMFSPVGDSPEAHMGKPLPVYYSFKAFNELYKLGKEVETLATGEKLYALSATDGNEFKTLITNNNDDKIKVSLKGFDKIKKIITISNKGIYAEVNPCDEYEFSNYETIIVYS